MMRGRGLNYYIQFDQEDVQRGRFSGFVQFLIMVMILSVSFLLITF